MIVSITEFNDYTGNQEDNDTLKQSILESAEQVVINYLGYNPDDLTYTEYYSGFDQNYIILNANPVTQINEISIDGTSYDPEEFDVVSSKYLYFKDRSLKFKAGDSNIYIDYNAGDSNFSSLIKLTILRIASLLLQESSGNIGITSKSFDNNSRTFINYTNFNKYLMVLAPYQNLRW